MDLGICLRNRMPVRTIMALARHAEDRGFHSVWITEGLGYKDVVTQMAAVATATQRIGVASGIIPIRTRTPLLLGNTFIGLDELSSGRAILGVGSGHPGALRDYHGIQIERPVAYMRDYLSEPTEQVDGRVVRHRIISAASHFTEPADLWLNNMEPTFRDRAPHAEHRGCCSCRRDELPRVIDSQRRSA